MAYAVELYTSGTGPLVGEDDLAKAGAAAPAGDQPVRFLGSIALPGDEVTFWLFDAPSTKAVAALLAGLGVAPERIVDVIAPALEARIDQGRSSP